MEIKIGIQNVAKEITLEVDLTADAAAAKVNEAITGATLMLTDTKGRRIVVPTAALAYVEIGTEEKRRIGFTD